MRGPSLALVLAGLATAAPAHAGDAGGADLAPRVPAAELLAARRARSPLPASPDQVRRGRALYRGKGFCAACHGRDGRGLGADVDTGKLRGPLPRDFTDPAWQRARADGELLWVLRNGSPGTAMAPFVPLVLSEREAWQVLLYVRSLGVDAHTERGSR